MPKQIKVAMPGSEDGAIVEVMSLGLFENGQTHDLTDEQVAAFEEATGLTWPEDGVFTVPEPSVDVEPEAEAKAEPVRVEVPEGGDK